jgi:hypothetical protein
MIDVEEVLRDELRRLEARCVEIREVLTDIQWTRYNLKHGVPATIAAVPKAPRKQPVSNTALNGTAPWLHRRSVVGA